MFESHVHLSKINEIQRIKILKVKTLVNLLLITRLNQILKIIT